MTNILEAVSLPLFHDRHVHARRPVQRPYREGPQQGWEVPAVTQHFSPPPKLRHFTPKPKPAVYVSKPRSKP